MATMIDQRPDPSSHLPLAPRFFQVLIALGDETMHGYGIIQSYEALAGGRETLLPGSLYATLARMTELELIEPAPAPPGEKSAGPKRRYVRATPLGTAVACAEAERMERMVGLARERSLGPASPSGRRDLVPGDAR